jgi:intracellular sulfur oxidation DsrE/DsrF family protein
MKKILTGLFVVALMFNVAAQETKQEIIIDVTSTDNKVYQSVLLTLKIMSVSHPNTKFDVIVYGEAVPMLLKDKSVVASGIVQFIENNNINFTACEVSMSLFNISKDQLINGVGTIDNAVVEIVKKQGLGWGYIKAAN